MTVKEAKEMIKELKAQGATEEELVSAFYGMFTEGKINLDELGDLVKLVGYELTDEFLNMSPEDQKTKGWADEDEEIVEEVEILNEKVREYVDMVDKLRNQGLVDEEILEMFYRLYDEKKVTIDELGDLVKLVGYELEEEYYKQEKKKEQAAFIKDFLDKKGIKY